MKYVVIIPDGAADEPTESLDGKTPLEAAVTPAMDRVSTLGVVGEAEYVPAGMPVGSDVAIMGLLGQDPRQHQGGRASFEAMAHDIDLSAGQWAIRCNLVTLADDQMVDPSAGGITTAEAEALLEHANQQLANQQLANQQPAGSEMRFVAGMGYRNLLIVGGTPAESLSFDTRMVVPNSLKGKSVLDAFPRGPGSEWLCDLMNQTVEWFADHPVNQRRRDAGLPVASCLWFWGPGQATQCPSFQERFGKSGTLIAAVDVVNGLGKMLGLARVRVPTATGMPDTDYAAKGRAACQALSDSDVVLVHIEAPDEAAHQGDWASKVAALESIDRDIVAPVLERLQQEPEWRILVSPDHQTLTRTGCHQAGPVCFAAAGSGISADDWTRISEHDAALSSLKFKEGWQLMPWFLGS